MFLIVSSDYVGAEFEAEIGKIPPCMLPIGNKKLIELQVQAIRKVMPDEKIFLTLPESYELKIDEIALINELKIVLRFVPDSFKFANAVLYVLNIEADKSDTSVRILYGHSLIHDLPLDLDVIAVINRDKHYNWHNDSQPESGENDVWGGYFAFSALPVLTKALALSEGRFKKAIQRYRRILPLQFYKVERWHDCGYINTFFNSRAKITTQRSFNSLVIKDDTVTKTSVNNQKIHAEAQWYADLPTPLKRFTPQLIDYGMRDDGQTAYYCLEYLPLLPLNELFVHGRNPLAFWKNIFALLERYLELSSRCKNFSDTEKPKIQRASEHLYREKSRSRLAQFAKDSHFDIHQNVHYDGVDLGTVNDISEICIEKAINLPCIHAVLHGDLCFSNILYDARGQRIKIIDPRGMDEAGTITNLGNQTYDVAKLAHSVIGLYDFIIAGRYRLTKNGTDFSLNFELDDTTQAIQHAFMTDFFKQQIPLTRVMPAVVLLFLSMLPLHSDRPDRQDAMLANALRLYKEYVLKSVPSQTRKLEVLV